MANDTQHKNPSEASISLNSGGRKRIEKQNNTFNVAQIEKSELERAYTLPLDSDEQIAQEGKPNIGGAVMSSPA